jgi:hypothetical protein
VVEAAAVVEVVEIAVVAGAALVAVVAGSVEGVVELCSCAGPHAKTKSNAPMGTARDIAPGS